MSLDNIKMFKFKGSIVGALLSGMFSLAIADSPEYIEHYKVRNDSSVPIDHLVISDFVFGDSAYHDPVLYADSLNLKEIAPSSGLGGLVSIINPIRAAWNGWDISYCNPTGCYKSDIATAVCSLTHEDAFPGSTAIVSIGDNGKVTIYKADQNRCDLQLQLLGGQSSPSQAIKPSYTEHYKVVNASSGRITNLAISDFVENVFQAPGYYHDPILTADSLDIAQVAPSTGLGGLVSYIDITSGTIYPYGWNGWDISYCTSSACYKSDMSVNTCSLKGADIFPGSTSMVYIGDNGLVRIDTPTGECKFQLGVDNHRLINN
ncbi:MAG: hypothetical protein K0R14_1274 [Burkholderiales bacterium]|nr:hypothetical protein [Burkholderiales bacterium]